jgi:hypothetical protein
MKNLIISFVGGKYVEEDAKNLLVKWLIEQEMVVPFTHYLKSHGIKADWGPSTKDLIAVEVERII